MSDFPKLGNRTLVHTKPALSLSDFFTGVLPPTPAVDYLSYRKSWPWWLNNQYGTCVCATWGGVKALVTALLAGSEVVISDAEITALYKTQNPNFPAEDNGMDIQVLLGYLQKRGDIVAFGTINKSLHDPVISIFGFVWISIAVRDAFYDDYNAGRPIRYVPSSTLRGYHSVFGAGHRDTAADDVRIETWTKEVAFTQAFWNSGDVGTIWGVILPEHLKSKEFMAGMDMVGLAAAFKTLTGRDLPLPPAPVPYTPRSSMSTTFLTPVRILDTRTTNTPLQPGEDRKVQVDGAHGIPLNAIGVAGDLAVTDPKNQGWLALTPTKWVGPSSNINFVAGQTLANGFTVGLAPDGTFSVHNGLGGTVHVIVDIAAYDI